MQAVSGGRDDSLCPGIRPRDALCSCTGCDRVNLGILPSEHRLPPWVASRCAEGASSAAMFLSSADSAFIWQ